MRHLRTDFISDECVRLLRAAVRWERGKGEPVRGWVIGHILKEGGIALKREWGDMQEWMTQRSNRAGPFFYTDPELPPQFQSWCGLNGFLYFLFFQSGSFSVEDAVARSSW